MKVGNIVTKDKVMKIKNPTGVVEKITDVYVVVKWHNIPGYWHYTHKQSEKLEVINEDR